jgi:subtilisin family serine protease
VVGVTLNVVDGKTLVKGMASDDYKLFFPNTVFDSHTQKTSGMMSYFTSEGPSSDTLTLKPQLSSPGQMILATWPLAGTGYTILSGTSMATPYMSGAFALLKSKFPNATVQQLREIMQSTARSVPYAYDTSIQAFAGQQGSGLINVGILFTLALKPT